MFKAGQVKTPGSGRKRGTGNKRLVRRLEEVLAEHGIDPAQKVLDVLAETVMTDAGDVVPAISAAKRLEGWLEILSYCQAKPKAVEVKEDELDLDDFAEVQTAQLLELVKKS